jgi:endonuclease YncB( thermonuclease family)
MKIPRLCPALRFAAVIVLGLYVSLVQAEILAGRVVKIADGDTLTVLDASKQQHRIRLTGIDAPEKKQAFGTVSKQHLAELVFGKVVDVEWYKRDRYQRVLGKVLVDGQDANLEQIKAGLAWHYKQYGKDQQLVDRRLYAEAQEAASIKGVGLWRDPGPIPPWDFRRK